MPKTKPPERAELVGGVWLPRGERHLRDMLLHHSKIGEVDGKATYQLHKLRAAMAHQPPARRGVCLDIGAHVGLWSMHLVAHFAQVHAFEPVPPHADIFPHNVAAGNVTLHRVALGNGTGTVSIGVSDGSSGDTWVIEDHANRASHRDLSDQWHGVVLRKLDSYAFRAVDFIKIDVEGYELPVVQGGRETILRCRPHVVLEQKGKEVAYGQVRNAALDYMCGLGMTPLCEPISGDWILGWPD